MDADFFVGEVVLVVVVVVVVAVVVAVYGGEAANGASGLTEAAPVPPKPMLAPRLLRTESVFANSGLLTAVPPTDVVVVIGCGGMEGFPEEAIAAAACCAAK